MDVKNLQYVQQSVATMAAGLRSACITSPIIAASVFTSAQINEHLKSNNRIFRIILIGDLRSLKLYFSGISFRLALNSFKQYLL